MVFKNLEFLCEKYDSFFIDVYGVLYNGEGFYDGALKLLEKLKNSGKKLIILSNTTLIGKVCKDRYSKKGLIEGVHYDEFLSSGEIFRSTLTKYLNEAKSYFNIFNSNNEIFEGSNLIKSDSIENADFVYVGALNSKYITYSVDNLKTKTGKSIKIDNLLEIDCHEIEGFEDIAKILDICSGLNKKLVVVNPDIFAIESIESNEGLTKIPVLCQGAVGDFYEKMGGEVLYFGKPYQLVYDFAKMFLDGCKKTAMIGDTLWTDILGGNMAGIDTILTLTGVSDKFFENMDKTLEVEYKIKKLIKEISPKMTHKSFKSFSQIPTHIVESFA